LKRNGFHVYDDAFSRDGQTLAMMSELFEQESVFRLMQRKGMPPHKVFGDDNFVIKDLLGGSCENTVFKRFKDNGYYTEALYFDSLYYMNRKGSCLDKADFSPLAWFQPLFYIGSWAPVLRRFLPQVGADHSDLPERIQKILSEKPKGRPFFLVAKAGADHTPMDFHFPDAKKWVASGTYQLLFKNDQADLLPALQAILQKDPKALVILIGDHGAARFRGYASKYGIDTLADLDRLAPKTGISKDDFMQDRFGVFLAVRMPGGDKDISHGLRMNNRDLFWHIFAELAKKPALLANHAPPDAFYLYENTEARKLCAAPGC
jgi:hypothetical protein